MKSNERETGGEGKEELPDARTAKIAEVREILRGSIGKVLKGKAQEKIEGLMEETSWIIKVSACETPEDFLALFALHGIPEKDWRIASKLSKTWSQGLYGAIHNRFRDEGGWNAFLDFMPPATKPKIDEAILELYCSEQVAACEIPEDFLVLFALHGMPEEIWRIAEKLRKNGEGHEGLYIAISKRFGGWNKFIRFMPPPAKLKIDESLLKQPFTDQVAACKTPEDFLALFALHNIPEEVWRNVGALRQAGYFGFYKPISKHFGGWEEFIKFMPPPAKLKINKLILKLPYTEQVAACKTREDFLALFSLHALEEDVWRNATKPLCTESA